MLNQELYEQDWEKALELIRSDNIQSPEDMDENMRQVYTSVAVAIVTNASMLNREFLSDITGLDLQSDEALYGYVIKTVKMTTDKAMKYGLTIVAQNGDLEKIAKQIMSEGF